MRGILSKYVLDNDIIVYDDNARRYTHRDANAKCCALLMPVDAKTKFTKVRDLRQVSAS